MEPLIYGSEETEPEHTKAEQSRKIKYDVDDFIKRKGKIKKYNQKGDKIK